MPVAFPLYLLHKDLVNQHDSYVRDLPCVPPHRVVTHDLTARLYDV